MDSGRDRRSVVTPDAFSVSEDLLGLPLARPRTRLAAILVDVIVIAVVSQLGWTVLGLLAAFYFFRMATRRSAGNALTRAAQYSMGCAGAFVLGITVIVTTGVVQDLLFDRLDGPASAIDVAGVGEIIGGVGTSLALASADTEDEAFEAATDLGQLLAETEGVGPDELEELLDELVPEDVNYDRDDLIERVVVASFAEAGLEAEEAAGEDAQTPSETLSLEDALAAYLELRASAETGALSEDDQRMARALGLRIATDVAGDTIESLTAQVQALREDVREEREDAREARRAAEAAQERGGLFAWIIDSADELGLGFGWGALYFSTLLAWTNGFTPGKRLFGLRVVRLNGEPMSWLMAFERAGGYAAGFATGLLGFAHMLWDPNRMGIHDKIAETVVIKAKAPRVPGPWSDSTVARVTRVPPGA